MKYKRRRVLEVPQKVRSTISSITTAALENIQEPLKGFVWEFDKGDFHHWVDLFNHFDSFFEKFIKPRKDLQVEDNFLEADPLFPRDAVLQILRVTRIILENCTNKHLYSSYEHHLSSLLASTDADVFEASLQTLGTFLKKPVGKCSIRDASLTSKLFAISQGWGSKEEGLGLIACSLYNGCDSVASETGSALHFEFYATGDSSEESNDSKVTQGLQVIHLPNIGLSNENDIMVLHQLVKEYTIPPKLRFSLLTRLRFARAFGSLTSRHQYICIRLYAFIALVQASIDPPDDLTAFFNNEPEFINELVSLLNYEDQVPEKIRILGILALVALCQDRTRQATVLSSVTSGGYRGILPSLMQKAVDAITSGSTDLSVVFVEALLSLVSVLVSSTPGSLALQEAGYIPTILPLLKDTNPEHLQLVSTAVHVVEGFLDFNNPTAALFRDLGGLDDAIARLMSEVSSIEKASKKNEVSHDNSKGKQVIGGSFELDLQPYHSETLVSYHRKVLMKALLRAISLATYVPGSSGRIDGSEESILPVCLCIIFKRAKDFGGGVFSLAAIVMSDLLHKDPTCFPVLDAAGLPRAFLDAIGSGVLCSAEAVTCIPQCLDALCLNNTGLQMVRDGNALKCFVKIFTSQSYLRALSGDTPGTLSSALDELLRHASSLRAIGVDMLIEILNLVANIGSGTESNDLSNSQSSASVPMETDSEGVTPVPSCEGEPSVIGNSEPKTESLATTSVSAESFLPECVSNVARLLETVLQNADTCRLFIEKKGLEAALKLFTLELMPIYVPIGQNLSVAFKSFSPQHSAALARAVCSFIREHLKMTNKLWEDVGGAKIVQIESAKQLDILRSLCSLDSLLSLSSSLLKGTTTMASELGSADADILNKLGKTYKEMLWQLSLSSDSKVEEKWETDKETGSAEPSVSNVARRESDDDGNAIPLVRYMNPVSLRSSSTSHWNGEHDFVSMVRSAGSMHRHGRHGLSRIRGARLSRHLDASLADSEVPINALENSTMLDIKKKSPSTLVPELLLKLGCTIRSLFSSLVKGLTARRRVDSNNSLSPASKSLVTALAKLFHDALNYPGHPTVGLETWSLKCRYLGKVVDDMAALIFDSRRHSCNTALVNSFYANGTFKEILTTFAATSQLLWTLPLSVPTPGHDQEISVEESKVSHSSWLVDTVQSYCRLLECHVNASLLLSPTPPSQVQLLVQPVAAGLSIGLFPIPREPEMFVRLLHSQVLDVILPVWNHPMFPNCCPSLITAVVSLVTHIYSGVGDLKQGHGGVSGSTGQRIAAPTLDESTISTIVEMGFARARAVEALRSVGTNSVEMATEWLFSHPEEFVQEDVQLAQALALSLGSSSEATRGDSCDEAKNVFTEDKGAETPPVDDILSRSMTLLQSSDSLAFHLTDLLVTLCNRNKGEDRPRVVLYLVQQLKQCPADFANETGALCPISHLLALTLSEDSSSRELAAKNGVISAVLDVLNNFRLGNESRIEASVTKSLSALFLILNYMLQSRPTILTDLPEGSSKSLPDSSRVGTPLVVPTSKADVTSENDEEKDTCNVFEKILGKLTGYMTLEESQKAMAIACEFVKQQVPAIVMQAVLQLCGLLTKTHAIATQFLEFGGLAALFSLPRSCKFPGFDSLVSIIIRHLLEDPQTLQTAMELEIRQTLTASHSRHSGRLAPRLFLTSMAPVISRDPEIFMKAAAAVCQLESSGGRINIILSKEKEKDRDKEKDKLRTAANEGIAPSTDPVRFSENKSTNDIAGKCPKSHKRVPASLYQVIDQLLEIIMSYPSAKKLDERNSSLAIMEADEPLMKGKGKSKVDETGITFDNLSERSASLSKITFVLKLMSDIILMYVHAVGVVLRRDLETNYLRGSCTAGGLAHGGIVHHVMHELLPLASEKTAETSDEWKDKLSEKASWFLVVLCGRSTEGRRRVISEVVKAFSSFSYVESNCSKRILLPDKKLLAFVDLVHSILSKNASSTVPGPGCSPDIAKTMIDGGIVQSLSSILRVIDLDHPDAPKIVNLILKALENLTRAANARDQVLKLDEINKKRFTSVLESIEGPSTTDGPEIAHANQQQEITDAGQTEIREVRETSRAVVDPDSNQNPPMGDDMRVDRQETANNPHTEDGVDFMHQVDGDTLPGTNELGLRFQVEHRTDDEMGDEDEDMGEDGEDDDDEDEEDEDEDMVEEAGAVISLADTDVEDHDDIGMDDEYIDDMIDEEENDFPENRVIEVRWRDGLSGMDQLRVLSRTGGRTGEANGFIDIASESFRGVNTDDIFRLHRPLGAERRRQTASRTSLDRSGLDGSAFQHPLLSRPSQSGDPISSIWSAAGNSSRDLEALSFGGFDVAHYYMFDSGHPSDHGAASVHGDHFVGAAPSALIDFSLGIDSQYNGGRRGHGNNRWTDDGQPQAGGHAATIAQAVEEHFVSQLHGAISVYNPVAPRQTEHSEGRDNQQSPVLNATPARANNLAVEPDEGQQQIEIVPFDHIRNVAVEGGQCLLDPSHGTVDAESVVGAEENQGAPEVRQMFSSELDAQDNENENMNTGEGVGPNSILVDTLPEADLPSAHLFTVDHHMQYCAEAPSGSQSADLFHQPVNVESHSSSHALIDSGSAMPDSSDGRAGSTQTRGDFDMNSAETVRNQAEISVPVSVTGEELSSAQNTAVPPENGQADQVNNNEASSTNTIDLTFLEALPEDLRAEVLASQQAQSAQASTYAPPPAEEIDPEFLAALPPDIQAEVLAQQRAQRIIQQTEGQPVDMDNASIIATFPPDLREEVLLTSSEAVLSALPSALLAEAQMLRDRAVSHYHARSSLFGGSHRLGSRRLAADRQAVMDRGVGVVAGQRSVSAVTNSSTREIEGPPLLDATGLQAVIRPVRLAQPLGKGLLQRLLLNLCAHSVQRANIVGHLVDMLRPEADCSSGSAATTSQRLYGCQWNVVYGQPSDGLPPLVSRRILEILTYLATNHSSVADILFYLDPSLSSETSTNTQLDSQEKKGKEKICDTKGLLVAESTLKFDIPLTLFLKLLSRPLFLRSNAHLEQVMGLLQVVVNNAIAKVDPVPQSETVKGNSETQAANDVLPDSEKDSSNLDYEPNQEINPSPGSEVPSLGNKSSITTYDIFLQLPKHDLRNLCSVLSHEGLSDKVYSLAADLMKNLAFVAVPHRKFFAFELAGLAHNLSVSAVGELVNMRNTHMLGPGSFSMAGAAILRVLQALSALTLVDGNKVEESLDEREEQSILLNLNVALEPLWQELSDCITSTEAKLGPTSSFSSLVSVSNAGDFVSGGGSLSSPLPPGTQQLLPFFEAFFVLCEKLQMNQTIVPTDSDVTAREVKEFAGTSSSLSLRCSGTGSLTFVKLAEKHRRLLNVFIRQNPSLLEKSLSMMLKVPRLIDFDNKRAYFRARIRQQHDHHHSAPLRISVRRAYVLEDSYNQLRMRPTQDLKGRLTVQFQGEEGIDAGGLTREWYQLLSRVIFDKGALLFTNVGNAATFQPNPNSVFQTEHLSYFKFVGRVVAKALFDGQLLDVYFTRSFYKHILGVKVTYHDIEAVDPDYYKNLKWMLENDVSDIPDLTFSMDADEEKHILYEKTEVTDYELKPGGRNIRVTEETKHEYVDLVAEHILTTAIRPQINSFLEGFNELVPRDLISIFNDKELELLISGLPEIDLDDLKANTEYTGYTAASSVINWFWEVVKSFNKEDMARFLQFVTGTSKVPLEGFKALQGISGPQRFQIHKAYGAPERLPSAHTCFNQLDLPEYSLKEQLEERMLLAIHEASEGFGFG